MPRLGSVTASMETVVRPLETETQPGLLLSDYDDVDFHALFSTSSDYLLLEQHLKALESQLQQATQDIAQLKEMKAEALQCPGDFVSFLRQDASRSVFPRLQRVMRVPDLATSRYQIRLTRRANTRFEQNLDYLLARVEQVHRRPPALTPALPSSEISVFDGVQRQEGKRSFSQMRSDFVRVLDVSSSVATARQTGSQPRHPVSLDAFINPTRRPEVEQPSALVHHPRPRQASRFAPASPEDFTDLNPMDYHRASSSAHIQLQMHSPSPHLPGVVPPPTPVSLPSASHCATPVSTGKSVAGGTLAKQRLRRAAATAPENTSLTHNIPWTDDEKRKLDYLLTVYPEEEIQARRHAKISAALGSRTPNQVASRVQKQHAKAQRQSAAGAKSGGAEAAVSLDEGSRELIGQLEDFFGASTDPDVKKSAEYAEYVRLKAQLEAIAANPINGTVHSGFRCDGCGTEPIIGPRWACCSCPRDAPSIDLCDLCISTGFETGTHKLTHVMKKIDLADTTEHASSTPTATSEDFGFLY